MVIYFLAFPLGPAKKGVVSVTWYTPNGEEFTKPPGIIYQAAHIEEHEENIRARLETCNQAFTLHRLPQSTIGGKKKCDMEVREISGLPRGDTAAVLKALKKDKCDGLYIAT